MFNHFNSFAFALLVAVMVHTWMLQWRLEKCIAWMTSEEQLNLSRVGNHLMDVSDEILEEHARLFRACVA